VYHFIKKNNKYQRRGDTSSIVQKFTITHVLFVKKGYQQQHTREDYSSSGAT
jgi:hypothetical protein